MAAPKAKGKSGDFTQNPQTKKWYYYDGNNWIKLYGPPNSGKLVSWDTLSPVLSRGESLLDAPPPNLRNPGQILRYPYEALTDETDYLQIDIRKYDSVATLSGGLTSNGTSRRRFNQPGTEINNVSGIKKPITFSVGDNVATLRDINSFEKTKLKSGQGSILLPMPSNIQDGNSVSFASGNLDGITAAAFKIASTGMTGATSDNILSGMTEAVKEAGNALLRDGSDLKSIVLTDLAAQAANIPLGGSLTRDAVFARQQGEIINQNVELLFNGVTLRSFKFSFKFTPRGPKEAQQVGLIINTFKKNMAAKVGGSIDGNFLGTPNVFELTYKRGASSHPFLHSFKQCVLTDMSVNYTGEGTYAVYDDSTPVSMVLELGFKELEPIYDADYGAEPGVGY